MSKPKVFYRYEVDEVWGGEKQVKVGTVLLDHYKADPTWHVIDMKTGKTRGWHAKRLGKVTEPGILAQLHSQVDPHPAIAEAHAAVRSTLVRPLGERPWVDATVKDIVDALLDLGWTHEVDAARIAQLEAELDEAQLRSIEARNPGIDMDEVRRSRSGVAVSDSQETPERPIELNDPCRCGHTFGYHCTPEFPNGGYCAASDTASPGYGCSCDAFVPVSVLGADTPRDTK